MNTTIGIYDIRVGSNGGLLSCQVAKDGKSRYFSNPHGLMDTEQEVPEGTELHFCADTIEDCGEKVGKYYGNIGKNSFK